MSDAARNPDDYCYRHPDRQSFVVCQRCGRTICPECQTPAAVGVHCPECVREARAQYREAQRFTSRGTRRPPRVLRRLWGAAANGQPVVTYAIMALCVIVWILEEIPGVRDILLSPDVAYVALYTSVAPWAMITNTFVHEPGLSLHLPLNMLSLFFIGPALESMLGRWRYLALYLIAGFGGSVLILLIGNPGVFYLGASGSIFGLLGAYFVIARSLGGSGTQVLVILVLNLALGFVIGQNVAWQAHVGGAITGIAVAAVMLATRGRRRRWAQVAGVAGIVVVLVAITVVGASTVLSRVS